MKWILGIKETYEILIKIKHRKNRMLRTKSSAFLNNICQLNKCDAYAIYRDVDSFLNPGDWQ